MKITDFTFLTRVELDLDTPSGVHLAGLKKSFDNYQRLAKGRLGMSSLWMGEDHLVFVKGSGFLLNFTEQYRRFRYQDIQYLAVTKTSRAGVISLHTLGFLTCISVIWAFIINGLGEELSIARLVSLAIFAAGAILFLCLLLRHILLGPTCYCDLKTSLKQERLSPLSRLHLANQAIDILREVVSEKQRDLENGAEPGEISLASLARAEEERLTIGKTVLPAFIDYSFFGLVALAALHLESIALCAAGLVLVILGNLMVFRSLIRSFRHATPDAIRRLLFTLLTSVMIFGGLAMVYFIDIVTKNTLFLESVTGPFEAFAGIPTLGGMVYYVLFLVSTLFVFGTAISGLFQTLKWQKRLNQGSPEVAP